MNSFEWNKIIGAVLGTAIFIFVIRLVAEAVYEPEHPAKPGYVVEGVAETPAAATAGAPAEEAMPDWGTVLASADVAAGQTIAGRCQQCHDLSKGGPNKIGPNLYGVVGAPRGEGRNGFAFSAAMKAKGGTWTYDELFKFIKAPSVDIPGTKMSFAGLRSAEDRIKLIAYLRSDADSPAPLPAPKPAAAEKPAADAATAAPAGAAADKKTADTPAAQPAPAK